MNLSARPRNVRPVMGRAYFNAVVNHVVANVVVEVRTCLTLRLLLSGNLLHVVLNGIHQVAVHMVGHMAYVRGCGQRVSWRGGEM